MNKIINLFLQIALSLLWSSCAKDIVDLTGDISGTVKDYSGGQFIENCKVSLSPGGASMTTSSSGSYEFHDLQPGDYTLSFSKAGYNDESTSVSVVAGQTSNVSVLLKAKSPFALSETVLDFGDFESSKIFYAFNNSDADCSFAINSIPNWLKLSQEEGTVKAGSSESISATIDRNGADYGSFSQTLSITYSGKTSGSVSFIVKFTKVQLSVPKVSVADDAENVTQNSFDIKGSIDATGGTPITSYGHCWSTSANPTINDNKTDLGSTTSLGEFTSNVTSLATFTTYYVRAYATNEQGTAYSQQISVTTQDIESYKWDGEIAKSFAGGKGTSVAPYVIKTGGQLLLIKDYKDKYFELGGNINLDNHNWLPIENFSGSIDGKGFIISNLKIERTGNNIGLFASTRDNPTISNVTIKGVNISASESSDVGAIVGFFYGEKPSMRNCTVVLTQGSKIYGNSGVGGMVGAFSPWAKNSVISNCRVESTVEDFAVMGDSNVGGLIGCGGGVYDSIESCKAVVNIKAGSKCGGIIGSSSCSITGCSYKGEIQAEEEIGGIAGRCGGSIVQCYSDSQINVSKGYAGGIVGGGECTNTASLHIKSCYSKGEIMAPDNVKTIGGIIGGMVSSYYGYIFHSYSTVSSTSPYFLGFGAYEYGHGWIYVSESATTNSSGTMERGGSLKNCATSCSNITEFMKECYSEYASQWNFNNSWIWEGNIDGKDVKVNCPKLAWE